MSLIKICGIKRIEDVQYVNAAMPDFAGFVFALKKRRISPGLAKQLKQHLHPEIKSVGVFLNEEIEVVADIANMGILDIIQLHGQESNAYIRKLKNLTGNLPVIKAVRVDSEDSIAKANDYECEYLLLDNGIGGTGQQFDWRHLKKQPDRPFFLAGGISIDNVDEAIKKFSPYAVDVSSSVETDGIKDKDKILEIVRRIRNV